MNLSAPFILRPVMTTFVMVAILLAGWGSFLRLPISDLPPLDFPLIQVTAGYTGASPDTVLNDVTIPLEQQLTQVKGIKEIQSISSPGLSLIRLFFDFDKDMKVAASDVQEALNRASPMVPLELDPRPFYERMEASQEPIMYLVLTADGTNIGELRRYANSYITPRLSRIEGVGQVQAYGSENSLWVRLNPELMVARHIGFNQVMDTIRQHTAQIPLGSIQTGGQSLAIELSGSVTKASQIADLTIGETGIHLRDIAQISEEAAQEAVFRFITPAHRQPAVILGIQRVSGANTVAISKAVHEAVSTIQKELPTSMHLQLWFDKAVWVQESITDVEWSLLIAFALVVLVIYLTLGRIREAIIPSITLPLALIGTFIVMYFLHFSLNLLSLLALTLCVGFVVDDAIVVLENIVRHQELGASRLDACLRGSRQICFTIVSMTLSLIAVFIPLLLMPGIMGPIFREFAVTLAVAILVSGLVSLTLTPMLGNRLLPQIPSTSRLQRLIHYVNDRLVRAYSRSLAWCCNRPKTVIFVALACIAVSIPLFPRLSVNLVPPEDRGYLLVFARLPQGSSPTAIRSYQENIEMVLQKQAHVDSAVSLVMTGDLIAMVRLKPALERPSQSTILDGITAELNAIPGILPVVVRYQLINVNFSFGEPGDFEYVVKGMDFTTVNETARRLAAALRTQPEFSFAQTSQIAGIPKLIIDVNELQARKLGLSKESIQGLLQSAYGQGQVGTLQQGLHRQRIFMELQEPFKRQPQALAKLSMTNRDGDLIPLRAIATWHEGLGDLTRIRREQFPAATVRFSIANGVHPQVALQKLEDLVKEIFPDSVKGHFDSPAEAMMSGMRDMLFLVLAAVVVMYIVLGILYESFIHPLTILSSLPFASLGGILTLILFNESLSIFSAVGFLLLIGIVKKNGIMMLDYALEGQRQGQSAQQAILEGARVRFRPIMMTTLAAIMGALPIAVGIGEGAAMHRGLGLVIVGGLLFSQLLTLYITPVLFLLFERLRTRSSNGVNLSPFEMDTVTGPDTEPCPEAVSGRYQGRQ